MKTTACFVENNGSFFLPFNEGGKKRIAEYQFVKETFSDSSRAYAYTRIQEFLLFCCHKCHRSSVKFCFIGVYMMCLCGF